MKKLLVIAIFYGTVLSGCMDDDAWYAWNDLEISQDTSLNHYLNRQTGLFIVNEGNFMYDNASLSYYLIDSMKVLNNVFFRANGVPLGDVALSMAIRDSTGYIIVNNSSRIYVIDTRTLKLKGKITGLVSPRHIHFISENKAYVSDLYAQSISIVDPVAMKLTGRIALRNGNNPYGQHPSEQMIPFGKYVFTNCWSYDNKVLVIDSETDQLVDSVEVIRQPNSMVLDRNNRLWVLCDGGLEGSGFGRETPGLVRINAATLEVERTYYFDEDDTPTRLVINGTRDTLYFLNTDLYRHPVVSLAAPEAYIENPSRSSYTSGYYSLAVDPHSGNLYIGDAGDHAGQGSVYRYRADGTPVDTFSVGITPGGFCFRE